MPVYFGTEKAASLYVGDVRLARRYIGEDLVFQKGAPYLFTQASTGAVLIAHVLAFSSDGNSIAATTLSDTLAAPTVLHICRGATAYDGGVLLAWFRGSTNESRLQKAALTADGLTAGTSYTGSVPSGNGSIITLFTIGSTLYALTTSESLYVVTLDDGAGTYTLAAATYTGSFASGFSPGGAATTADGQLYIAGNDSAKIDLYRLSSSLALTDLNAGFTNGSPIEAAIGIGSDVYVFRLSPLGVWRGTPGETSIEFAQLSADNLTLPSGNHWAAAKL